MWIYSWQDVEWYLLLHYNLCSSSVSHGAQGHYARKLLNDLMEDYSNALRPVEDTDSALNVSLQITLSQIKDMVSPNNTTTRQQQKSELYTDHCNSVTC